MDIGNFDIKGRGYVWKLERGKSEPIKKDWTGDQISWIMESLGYEVKGINKDGVPIVTDKEITRKERIEANMMIETLLYINRLRKECIL